MAVVKTSTQVRALLGKMTIATGKTITATTKANPVVVTSATHGFSVGDTVAISAVGGAVLTNNVFTISAVSASTFTIPLDGSGDGSYTSGGTAVRVTSALTPGDLEDINTTLDRMSFTPRGEDAKRSSESSVKTIFGV